VTTVLALILVVAVIVCGVWWSRQRAGARRQELDDAKAESRRWVERLGGQVLNLVGTNDAAKQALADAAERHTAAGSQMEQAHTLAQCQLTTETALEGLHYVRAARVAMDMDPGPELPNLTGSNRAGKVTEFRQVDVEGKQQYASPSPTDQTPHYYPGGTVAGRPVPEGWYSEPWWKPALVAGAWGVGSFLLMNALFDGMSGFGDGFHHDGWGGFDGGFGGGFDGGFGGGFPGDGGFGGGFPGGGFDGPGFGDGGGFF
jgi:hypothetical protein